MTLDPHTERLRRVSAMGSVEVTERDVRRARRAYYGNISYLDDWTARLMSTLQAVDAADDTIVIVLADHGDMLGERGLWYKMNFFEGSGRVPLIVHSPKRFAPKRVAAPVSLVDILPTITDLCGDVAPDSIDPLAGRSLLPLLEDTQDAEREVIGEYMGEGAIAPIVMIRRGDLKYVHSPVDPDQLYDLAADPDERVNLAQDHDWSAMVKGLREEVERRWDMDRADPGRHRRPAAPPARRQGPAHRHADALGVHPAPGRRQPVHAQPHGPQRPGVQHPLAACGPTRPPALNPGRAGGQRRSTPLARLVGHHVVLGEGAGEGAGAVGHRPQVDGVADQLGAGHVGAHGGPLVAGLVVAEQPAAPRGQVAHHRADVLAGHDDRDLLVGLQQAQRRGIRGVAERPARPRSGRQRRRSRRCAPCRR